MTGNVERSETAWRRINWVDALPVSTVFVTAGWYPAEYYVAVERSVYGRYYTDIEDAFERYYAANFAHCTLRRVVQTFGGLVWTRDCV